MVFQGILVDPFMHRFSELQLCALMPRKMHIIPNYGNEPGKVPNLNMVICRVYVHHRKNLNDTRKEILIPDSLNLGNFPLEIMKLPQ